MKLLPVVMLGMFLASFYFTWRKRYRKPERETSAPDRDDPVPDGLPADALQHKDWRVRKAAVVAAGAADGKAAIPDLLAALSDSDPDVRETARTALERFGPDAVPGLLDVLQSGGQDARILAADALGHIGDAAAVAGLVAAMKDDVSAWVRGPAAAALGAIGDGSAVPDLTGALRDPDADVRQAAKAALRQIGTPEALSALEG